MAAVAFDCTTADGRRLLLGATLDGIECAPNVSAAMLDSIAATCPSGTQAVAQLYFLLAQKARQGGSKRIGALSKSSTGSYSHYMRLRKDVLRYGAIGCGKKTGVRVCFSPGEKCIPRPKCGQCGCNTGCGCH